MCFVAILYFVGFAQMFCVSFLMVIKFCRQVDCCRHSLFFPDVSGLLAGLRTVAMDPDVEIVYIKNRLNPDYDSRSTAGYRDVLVNLRLRTLAARRLNLDHHVWELQLMLISFARIKVHE